MKHFSTGLSQYHTVSPDNVDLCSLVPRQLYCHCFNTLYLYYSQVYHMCDDGARQYSYICPNTTLFHQRMLICAHWYQVNCSYSEHDFDANLLIGQQDKPFVEEDFWKHRFGGGGFKKSCFITTWASFENNILTGSV